MAEPAAIVHALTAVRPAQFPGPLHWGTDSMYALGIMLYAHAASTETALDARARAEAMAAIQRYNLTGEHTPTHIGNPPNKCADVTARLGRKAIDLSEEVMRLLQAAGLPTKFTVCTQDLSSDHLLQWAALE